MGLSSFLHAHPQVIITNNNCVTFHQDQLFHY